MLLKAKVRRNETQNTQLRQLKQSEKEREREREREIISPGLRKSRTRMAVVTCLKVYVRLKRK